MAHFMALDSHVNERLHILPTKTNNLSGQPAHFTSQDSGTRAAEAKPVAEGRPGPPLQSQFLATLQFTPTWLTDPCCAPPPMTDLAVFHVKRPLERLVVRVLRQ